MNQKVPIVFLKDIVKQFPSGDTQITVLDEISLVIDPGEFVAIVGASGNGKSTLLNMVTGIDRPTAGEIYVTGEALHQMNEEQLAVWRGDKMGVVFQFFQLLPSLNLLQNVILPMDFTRRLNPKERRERAGMLLDMVGLSDQTHKLPNQVSGGQQQRAAIARALANDPDIIVADEPTGNLDARTSEEVFEIFNKLVDQGKTVIMVTHDEDLACRVPRRIEIRNGRIHLDGKCEDSGLVPEAENPAQVSTG